MPSIYKNPFTFKPNNVIEPIEIELYECPNCKYRIPILPEHFDYREMYEEQIFITQQLVKKYELFLEEIAMLNPDAEVLVEKRRSKMKELIKQLREMAYRARNNKEKE
jgi:hypothetical protein